MGDLLPILSNVLSSSSSPDAPLAQTLSVLFEPSLIIQSTLVPQLATSLSTITSYSQLIDVALARISTWDDELRAQFIAGHPRIGESKNLSSLSAKEQGATAAATVNPTQPVVLTRLAHLNACYERRYLGLRYITFVNGRSRAVIAQEIEDVLGMEHSVLHDQPDIDGVQPVRVGGVEWRAELDRAIVDVGRIAKSRLGVLGVQ